MKYVLALIGFILGAASSEIEAALTLGGLGLLLGWQIEHARLIRALRSQLRQLQDHLAPNTAISPPLADKQPDSLTTGAAEHPAEHALQPPPEAAKAIQAAESSNPNPWTTHAPFASSVSARRGTGAFSHVLSHWWPLLANYFTRGNPVVKLGFVVLFFGVSFLLKYAAEHSVVPLELRFIAVACAAIVLLLIGWRLRLQRPEFALPLQGGAMGMLYITVFAASKLFALIPLTMSFVLLLLMVTFTCVLAVLQNAKWLAVLATVGGFLAPILTSSGSGNHVALFSYYCVLNAGILGLAWYRSWRILNWLGFVFTFVIAGLWLWDSYQPEHYRSTQPFLLLFFVFYVMTSVLYALRQAPQLRGLVDASLVFGVPLIAFTLQGRLVDDFEFGLAYSALAMSLFYLGLARLLWQREGPGLRLLIECFLALGILFATLCIPFVLEGEWTGATWALEGAGMVWVGLRQKRRLPRWAGYALTLLAAVLFATELPIATTATAVFNGTVLSAALIALSGLFISWHLYQHREALTGPEKPAHWIYLVWGLCWWFATGLFEITRVVHSLYTWQMTLSFTALSCLVLVQGALRWHWLALRPLVAVFIFSQVLWLLWLADLAPLSHPFSQLGFMVWPLALTVALFLLRPCEPQFTPKWRAALHSAWTTTALIVLCWGCSGLLRDWAPEASEWVQVCWAILPAAMLYLAPRLRLRFPWPCAEPSWSQLIIPGLALWLSLWLILSSFSTIDPAPLPYLPLLNILDLTQLLILFTLLEVLLRGEFRDSLPSAALPKIVLGGLTFTWLNSVLAHAIHYYAAIPFRLDALLDSELYQSGLSILWTLCALLGMIASRRWQLRPLWILSAVLLALVVLKLFVADLNDSGTITRIVSFLSVGLLMLGIGYLAPIPPPPIRADSPKSPNGENSPVSSDSVRNTTASPAEKT